ncbi:serine hydrolase [Portibacter marinus]|uniref:serine hydrolase n=1 Tax=Portibacter marinus TaxID=2898660 RepID=UPI001F377DDC|nr:serine hydrolase [Portibacter marinus]
MKYTIITIIIAVSLVFLLSFTNKFRSKKKEHLVLNYIKENPEKSAITIIKNGEKKVDFNSDKLMPLASTVKIIIAIEYAEQAAAGLIDPQEVISFDLLDQYYIPGTDGGAHMAWFKSIKNDIIGDGITLKEIAKGMIDYSSNANTEFLCDKLGLENVNDRIGKLGIDRHSEIYYIVSALFVDREMFPDLTGQELTNALEEVPMEDYISISHSIHDQLSRDFGYKDTLGELNLGVQKVWSDRLPASTTGEYAELMRKINGRTFFDSKVQQHLNNVLEGIMDSPANKTWLRHAGAKGGSTAFVLTKAFYSTDKEGNTTELAYFFNDVGFLENSQLQRAMNQFELKILRDPSFLELLIEGLAEID